MYDHIKLRLPYPFKTEGERANFCERYGLCEVNDKLRTWNNADFKDLKQNRSVYIKLHVGDNPECGFILFSFSLHKFYNLCLYDEALNWDDFTFAKANRAKTLFCEFFPQIDFKAATVIKYEVGLNIQCSVEPERIMEQLDRMVVKDREYRIIEDRNQTEYKQYGTNQKKRMVYTFYNKTYETRSKQRTKKEYYEVPENILRCEKDNRRLIKKTMFFELFKKDFQKLTKNEFRSRFVNDIFFKEMVPKSVPKVLEGLTRTENNILNDILEKGEGRVEALFQASYNRGETPRRTFYRRKAEIKKIRGMLPELVRQIQDVQPIFFKEEYKKLITDKLNQL